MTGESVESRRKKVRLLCLRVGNYKSISIPGRCRLKHREEVLAPRGKQLMRSGTSIGGMVREAEQAESS